MDTLEGLNSLPSSTYFLFTTLASLITLYVLFQFSNRYFFWQKRGLKGERLIPIFGDFAHKFEGDPKVAEREKVSKYGKVHGQYAHGLPRLFIADPEVIRQICIKDHDAFPNHTGMRLANKYQQSFLIWLKGDHWRMNRAIMTPSFTSGKIKRMFRFLDECAEDLISNLTEKCELQKEPVQVAEENLKGYLIDIKETSSMYSMDGISTCGYGLKLKREQSQQIKQNGLSMSKNGPVVASRDDFAQLTLSVFRPNMIRLLITTLVPTGILNTFGFCINPQKSFEPLVNCLKQLMRRRQDNSNKQKFDDLLQSLVDAKLDDKIELDELDRAENHHAALTDDLILGDQQKMVDAASKSTNGNQTDGNSHNLTTNQTGKGRSNQLSETEVLSGAMFLLAAGLETTSVLLTNCIYCLAYHPEIQEKLHSELEKIVEFDASKKMHIFQYESLTSCEYLDAVISETLRYLPPAPYTGRTAEREYHIEKYNITIPKGCSILLAIRSVQNSYEFWDEPDKYNPDRFLPENRDKIIPGSYIPFSLGPRHCIGMRFSLTEAKLGLAKVIMKFRFRPAPGAPYPPKVTTRPGVQRIEGPRVLIIPRV